MPQTMLLVDCLDLPIGIGGFGTDLCSFRFDLGYPVDEVLLGLVHEDSL